MGHFGSVPIGGGEKPAKREYFFSHHEENRIELSKGRDVILMPKQKGEPLNFFVYPYTGIDGQAYSEAHYEVSYRDVDSQTTHGKASTF